MRMVLFNIAVVAGVIWMGAAPANAAPPSLSGIGNTGMFVARGERVAYRRYHRRHGYASPYAYYPPPYGYLQPPAYAYPPAIGDYPPPDIGYTDAPPPEADYTEAPPEGDYADAPPSDGDYADGPPPEGY